MVNLPILPVFLKKPYLHAFKTQKILIMADVTLTAYNVKTKKKMYLFRKLWFQEQPKEATLQKAMTVKATN